MVGDLHTTGSSNPQEITAFNNLVFFTADDGTGRELYSTDGSTINLVARTALDGVASVPSNLTVVGNDLFFSAIGKKPAASISTNLPELTADNSIRSGGSFAGIITSVSHPEPRA